MNKQCGECSRVSNNTQFNCPPHMSDGRGYTDYRPRCISNYMSPRDTPLNSYEYRQYLISNAEQIMAASRVDAYKQNQCGPCMEPYDTGTMLPEQNIVECDASTCKSYIADQNGVGTGRQYMDVARQKDPSKNAFLKVKQNEQMFFKQFNNCCGNAADDIKYYPYDGVVEQEYSRLAMPGGGVPMSGGDRM